MASPTYLETNTLADRTTAPPHADAAPWPVGFGLLVAGAASVGLWILMAWAFRAVFG